MLLRIICERKSPLILPSSLLAMSPSLNVLLGLLATLPHCFLAQASNFPVPFLEPLLEERQASTVPDYVITYGMQQSHQDDLAVQA